MPPAASPARPVGSRRSPMTRGEKIFVSLLAALGAAFAAMARFAARAAKGAAS